MAGAGAVPASGGNAQLVPVLRGLVTFLFHAGGVTDGAGAGGAAAEPGSACSPWLTPLSRPLGLGITLSIMGSSRLRART